MKLDGVGLDYGKDGDFERTRLLWLWDIESPIKTLGSINLNGHFELAMGQTQPSPPDVTIGITPVLEWRHATYSWLPFIETGLGANYISKTENQGRTLSTHFQFGEILGVAIEHKGVQLGLRYQHLSNADIVKPNNGYNFYGVVFKYHY